MPQYKDKSRINILDVGCGSAATILFAASQGYKCAGIDISETAIQYAKKRFKEANLQSDLFVSGFFPLKFEDEYFDFIIDSGALCCVDFEDCEKAIAEIHRTLKKSARFFFTPFSDRDSSAASGTNISELRKNGGFRENISTHLIGYGSLYFHSASDIQKLLSPDKWNILSMRLNEAFDYLDPSRITDSRWEIIAEKY